MSSDATQTPSKRITRNEMLRAWAVFYRTKGTPEAVALASHSITVLTHRLKVKLRRDGPSAVTVCMGMAIGVHKYALWSVNNRRGV